jgi:hypothetical protein
MKSQQAHRAYLAKRVKAEAQAAVRAKHPKACAAHVQLANEYLRELNASEAASKQ